VQGMAEISVVIAAAGASRRMGAGIPKQYRPCAGEPVLIRSCRAFAENDNVSSIVVAVPDGDESYVLELLEKYDVKKVLFVVSGGAERRDSVAAALSLCPESSDFILVHDGARPFVSQTVIDNVINALKNGAKAVVPGVTPKNTIRTAAQTLDRSLLYEVQTPQGFCHDVLIEAYDKAFADGFLGTDDAGLVERLGVPVNIVSGDYANLKITTPEDLPMEIRTGNGYDLHRLVPGRKLMLGCVEIPYEKGLLGHSDADVICHALADALLGAAHLGDIGRIFPDSSPETEGMAGAEILSETAEILRSAGFTIINADVTLIAEKPKIAKYAPLMEERIAEALGIDKSRISVKAKTNEGLDAAGKGEAMAAFAAASVK